MQKLKSLAGWRSAALVGAGLLAGIASVGIPAVRASTLSDRLDARVQQHRNAPRGMEFIPLASTSGSSANAKTSLKVDVILKLNLDGNALDNVYGNVLPLDWNENGTYEYLHYNGFNYMQSFNSTGRKVWRISNPAGRKNSVEQSTHRDGAAIFDIRGVGQQDIVHCWAQGSQRLLIARRGDTGQEIRRVKLDGPVSGASGVCYISVYRMQSTGKPIILVASNQPGGSSKCGGHNYIDYWAKVEAFDASFKKLWSTDTCNAGHLTAQVDENGDGKAEYFFVGKYALDEHGKIRCTLGGWSSRDHVDAIRIGKLDPKKSGIQAVAVGETGMAAFSASSCKRLWSLSTSVVKNPQEVALAQVDPAPKPLSIVVTQRGSEPVPTSYLVSADGKSARNLHKRLLPMQNVELDGDKRTDELFGLWGFVWNGKGQTILNRDWYWGLKGSKVKSTGKRDYDKWAPFPVMFDVDRDGKQEIVVWGESLIVVGRPH